MSFAPNFELVTELQTLIRRDFTLVSADDPKLDPLNANPIIDGEWLELDTTNYALKRGSASTTPLQWPVHTERGRYDTQAVRKVNVLYLGMYEAETRVINTASLVVGSPLMVGSATVDSLTRRGLLLQTGAGTILVGYVTKIYSSGPLAGRVRFVHFGNEFRAA